MFKTVRTHAFFLALYGGLFLFFLWPLIFLKSTFINGDYWQQFFPWSYGYAQSLKSGQWPYWTSLMACGFPLLAEGQVGAYYLAHLFSYWLLPFEAAYTWGIPAHILAGGIGFYLYGRSIGLSKEAAVLSATLYSFSSAYGGCFYTTGTLRVLSWLPWCLWAIEKKPNPLLMGVFFSQMWTAGFPQLAAYSMLYLFLIILFKEKDRQFLFLSFILANGLGLVLAIPQLAATVELARVSVRAGESVQFALWGSVFPPSLVSLVFPHWGRIFRVFFYIGILPLGFVTLALFSKKGANEKMHGWLALIFILMAFGQYNPLYAGAVKALSLTFVRNPSKFLFFSTVSLAVLAGFGFDKRHASKKTIFIFWSAIVLAPLIISVFFRLTEGFWIEFSRHYAQTLVSQKGDTARALRDYYQMADDMLERFKFFTSYRHPWSWTVLGLATTSAGVLWARQAALLSQKVFKWLVAAILGVDLILYGIFFGIGFMGNAKPFALLQEKTARLHRLKELNVLYPGNVVEWQGSQADEWLAPSSNMLYSLPHAGAYSPLLIQRYYELTKDLGFVDSSLGRRPFSKKTWVLERPLLDLLGVSLILSDEKLSFPRLRYLEQSGPRFIYKNESLLPKAYAVFDWKNVEDAEERLKILKNPDFDPHSLAIVEGVMEKPEKSGARPDAVRVVAEDLYHTELQYNSPSTAIVLFRNAYYPRWRVSVDGKERRFLAVDHALSGVWVEKGLHRVYFHYDSGFHKIFESLALFVWVALLFVVWLQKRKSAVTAKIKMAECVATVWLVAVLAAYVVSAISPKIEALFRWNF